jgi:RecB family exonuclease
VVAGACRDAGEGAPPGLGDPVALAATRVAVLDELDPDRRTRAGRLRWAGLGPYFGFVGAPLERADPRRDPPFLTRIECIATCPWQAFLRHLLHVAQPPDSALLPGLGANLVGALLHAVLARIVREAIGSPPPALADALACEPTPVPWPAAGELERLLDEEARALLRREGIALAGLARLLATQARPALLRARDLEWGGGTATVAALAAEASGEVSIPGKTRPIRFIADRVDRGEDGAILTDYKTGVPFSDAKQRTTQRRHLLAAVRSGRRLQAAAYALASGSACGRYLFLRPGRQAGLPSELRFEADDPDLPAVFAAAVGAALTTWDAGSLFPRLVTPDGRQTPPACTGCEVRDACLQGDSGARARLLDWAVEAQRAADEGRPSASPAEAAMLAAWRLAFKEKDATSSAGEGS